MPKTEKKQKLVLIVEDDKILCDLVTMLLEGVGLRTETARDGIVAIDRIPVFKPDLILLDLMLPGPSGLDILKQLQTGDYAKIPVVVFTAAYRGSSLAKLALEFPNVLAWLEKPVDAELVKKTILQALQ